MVTYLLLSGPGLSRLDSAALDARIRADAPSVLLQADDAALWADSAGGCLLWTWASPDETLDGRRVHASPAGVVALAGSAWSRTSLETAARLSPDQHPPQDPTALRGSLTGSFSAVSIHADGRGFVTTDSTGTGHVYAARGADIWAASNRAPLAALGLHGRWEPDVESQAWMAMLAMYGGTATSVRGVELLPAAAALRLAPGTVPALERGATPWERGAFSSIDLDQALDDAAHALTERASVVASTTAGTPVVSLSGGKDSRLVLAALRAAGCADDLEFRTIGLPGAGDREVATLLGRAYGLDVAVDEPGVDTGPSLAELDQRVRRHAFQTAGMLGAWDLQGFYGHSAEINLTGLYGEMMRTVYPVERALESLDQAVDHLQNRMGWDRNRLLRPGAREAVDGQLAAWATDRVGRGWTPQSLLDLFYAETRIARWLGTAEEVNSVNTTANLLQVDECLVAGAAAGPEARGRDELHFRLIERLDPSLLSVPLAEVGWDPGLAEPGGARNPRPIRSTVVGSESWQVRGWRSHRRLIAAELLAADNVLHEIVDPTRLVRVTSQPQSPRRVAQLWAIWAGSIWTSRAYEIFPWNGPPTSASVAPSRLVAAAFFKGRPGAGTRPSGTPDPAASSNDRPSWRARVTRRLTGRRPAPQEAETASDLVRPRSG